MTEEQILKPFVHPLTIRLYPSLWARYWGSTPSVTELLIYYVILFSSFGSCVYPDGNPTEQQVAVHFIIMAFTSANLMWRGAGLGYAKDPGTTIKYVPGKPMLLDLQVKGYNFKTIFKALQKAEAARAKALYEAERRGQQQTEQQTLNQL